MADHLITKQEFELRLNDWGESVKRLMLGKLSSGTHGSGFLRKKMKVKVRESRKDSTHWVGFNFPRYGVFVHYGVGRGWVRSGGAVVRGQRVKKNSSLWHQLRQKGYSRQELTDYVVPLKGGKARKPLDWFDSVLKARIEELSEISADYYGDNTLEQLKEMMSRMTIDKGNT